MGMFIQQDHEEDIDKEITKEYIVELLLNGEEWRREDIIRAIKKIDDTIEERTEDID